MKLDPITLHRLVKTLRTIRSLVPFTLAVITTLALIGIIQPLGEEIEGDDFVF